ncbi:MAG: hypothetical protein P8P74_08340 [Crocinitomicaceae bacterium]|nr:hypothetical protein [Crocinitomicaceae bacterium]
MKNTRTKVIVSVVAILTAGSLFAVKVKMMHHKKAKMGNCHAMRSADGHEKFQDHHKQKTTYQVKRKKESADK